MIKQAIHHNKECPIAHRCLTTGERIDVYDEVLFSTFYNQLINSDFRLFNKKMEILEILICQLCISTYNKRNKNDKYDSP